MATLMFLGSSGSEDPTKAVFPFILANGAVEAGHQAQVSLFGDAVVLMNDAVINSLVALGWPPLRERRPRRCRTRSKSTFEEAALPPVG